MSDFTRNTFMWVFVAIGILILIALIISSSIIYYQVASVSNNVQTKLDSTNELLTKLNKNIQGLDQLNEQIRNISARISSIEKSVSGLPNNTQSLSQVQTNLLEVKQELNTLSKIYPPNQTIILNNLNEDSLNTIINNVVKLEFQKIEWKTNFNFILNIIFGSLLSLGGISLAIYYTAKKKK
jgi:ABC-type transporter Mla subunit MlaD